MIWFAVGAVVGIVGYHCWTWGRFVRYYLKRGGPIG